MLYTYQELCERSARAANYNSDGFTSDGCVKSIVNGAEKMLLSCESVLAKIPSNLKVFFGASAGNEITEYSCDVNSNCEEIRGNLTFSR